ncbi:CoA pyrophosphatase [Endozoicomonadaceae bacterium StTr2]
MNTDKIYKRNIMLDTVCTRLQQHQPRPLHADMPEAAVLIPLTDTARGFDIILTQRAAHLNTHSGQVALPGGKRDDTDASLAETALRETEEEIGLDRHHVSLISEMSPVVSRHGIKVTPFTGLVPEGVNLCANEDELDSIFRVPVDFLLEDRRLRTDRISFKGKAYHIPAWQYEGYTIWGLTAMILVEFLNVAFNAEMQLKPEPQH